MDVTPLSIAQRYLGVGELPGAEHHPLIQWWISLCEPPNHLHEPDEIPWCNAFVNGICWELSLPRSKNLAARSSLMVGKGIDLADLTPGFDIVILWRGTFPQPGPEVLAAPGHVGFFAGWVSPAPAGEVPASLQLLAGNQGNRVTVEMFPASRVLGARRLLP